MQISILLLLRLHIIIRRTIDITDIFNHPEEFIASMDNVIIESDFVKAATTLKESRKRAETAKFRYDFYKNQRI